MLLPRDIFHTSNSMEENAPQVAAFCVGEKDGKITFKIKISKGSANEINNNDNNKNKIVHLQGTPPFPQVLG